MSERQMLSESRKLQSVEGPILTETYQYYPTSSVFV